MTTNGHNRNGNLPIHELAYLFPSMTDEEMTDLKTDMGRNGVHQAIAVWHEAIIDGRQMTG